MSNIAHIYTRVSTKRQDNTEGGNISLYTQESVCREKAESLGYKNIVTYKEVVSGGDMKKQIQLNRILRQVKNGDIVIFYAVSRFSRNVEDGILALKKLRNKKIKFYFCQENIQDKNTSTSKLMLHNMLVNSEFERLQTSERVKSSIKKRRSMGSYIGNPGFGYKVERLNGIRYKHKNNEEQAIIKYILDMRYGNFNMNKMKVSLNDICDKINKQNKYNKQNYTTYREIANILNEEEIYNRKKLWTANSIKNIVYTHKFL